MKYDLQRLLSELGHNIYNLKITTFVKENEYYHLTGSCELFDTALLGYPKILNFRGTYGPQKREFTSFEILNIVNKI